MPKRLNISEVQELQDRALEVSKLREERSKLLERLERLKPELQVAEDGLKRITDSIKLNDFTLEEVIISYARWAESNME